MGEDSWPHLQNRLSEENHFPSCLFDDEVLYLVPIVVRPTSPEMHFVNRVFFITCCSGGGLVGYIGNKIVEGRGMIWGCVQI